MRQTAVIKASTPPTLYNKPEVKLRKGDFDSLIEQKGYEVYHDKMIECPCKSKGVNSFRSDCRNCGGYGWVLVERVKTKMVLQSMNMDTRYKDWSVEKIGTASITCRYEDFISHGDRINILGIDAIHNQIIYPVIYPALPAPGASYFSFLIYSPTKVEGVYRFNSASTKLVLISSTLYSIDENKIVFSPTLNSLVNPVFNIRYRHLPQFTVIDIGREVMLSPTETEYREDLGPDRFPIHAIGRRSHLVIDKYNYEKNNIIDNT